MYKIALRGKDGLGKYALVDEEDYEWLSSFAFQGHLKGKTLYAKTTLVIDGVRRKMSLHRMIMEWYYGDLGDFEVDHIDGDALNNKKDNLRLVTHKENMRNIRRRQTKTSSKYKGVFKEGSTYRVMIRCEEKLFHFGHYRLETDAAVVYNIKAKELFGDYACLNDIETSPEEMNRIIALMNDPKRREGYTSHYRGVSLSHGKAWRAAIGVNGRDIKLGSFKTQEEAALAYNEAATKHLGDKARLNVIPMLKS